MRMFFNGNADTKKRGENCEEKLSTTVTFEQLILAQKKT